MISVKTFFNTPKNAAEAARQTRICDRAATLFQNGYSYELTGTCENQFYVNTPEGKLYIVDMIFDRCNCKGFENDLDCKHRIAVSEEEMWKAVAQSNGVDWE